MRSQYKVVACFLVYKLKYVGMAEPNIRETSAVCIQHDMACNNDSMHTYTKVMGGGYAYMCHYLCMLFPNIVACTSFLSDHSDCITVHVTVL